MGNQIKTHDFKNEKEFYEFFSSLDDHRNCHSKSNIITKILIQSWFS